MTENEQPAPETTPTPAAPAAPETTPAPAGILREKLAPYFDHAPPEMQTFLRKYGVTILTGIAVGLVGVAGVNWYRSHQAGKLAEADRLAFSAAAPEQLQKVLEEYPDSPSAPAAALFLASAQFGSGQYELAGQMYSDFLSKYPNHPHRTRVELNVAICKESAGQFEAALDSYKSVGERNRDSYIYAETVFGRGRCLEQLGRFAEAKSVYEDFVAGHPDSPWLGLAERDIRYAEKSIRSPQAPKAAAPGGLAPLQISPVPVAPAAAPVAPTPAPTPAPAP